MNKINCVVDDNALLPTRAHDTDAGYDLYIPTNIGCTPIYPDDGVTIDTGVHLEIPKGYVGFIKSKSGLNVKYGIQCEGVIDSGYTGSIKVKAYNHGDNIYVFNGGEKICQLVLLPIFTPELNLAKSLTETERGDNGFGSTGK